MPGRIAKILAIGLLLDAGWARAQTGQPATTLQDIAGTPLRAPEASAAATDSAANDTRLFESRTRGIKSASLSAVAMSPSDPRTLLVATTRGVLWQSLDAGRSWTETLRIRATRNGANEESDRTTGADTGDLTDENQQELDELRQQTIDDLVAELTPTVGEDEAQRQAEDEAERVVQDRSDELQQENVSKRESSETDDASGPPARSANVRALVFDPTFPGLVYAATRDGVYRSGDAGTSWAKLPAGTGDEDRDAICVAPSAGSPDRILIGTGNGLLLTADGGGSWSRATGEIANLEIRAIAVDPDHRNVVAVGTPNGAYLSVDGGDSFRRVYSASGQAADVRAIAFGPGGGADLWEGTASGLWLVTPEDSIPMGSGSFGSQSVRALVIPPGENGHVYVLTGRGIFESKNASTADANFYELERGLESTDVRSIAEDVSSADGLLAATALGIYRLVPERTVNIAIAKLGGPTLAEMVRAASRYSQIDGTRLSKLQRDAKISPWLPDVIADWHSAGRMNHSFGYDEVRDAQGTLIALDPTGDSWPYLRNDQMTVSLRWNFDELIFNTRKARVMSEIGTISRSRSRRLSKVARLARERRDLANRLAGGMDDAEERNALTIRLQELEALLDAATGGAITRSQSGGSR